MTRFRISGPAGGDLEHILEASLERWGEAGRRRYGALLAAAMHAIARAPAGPTTRARSELSPGIRSFHVRHARAGHGVHEPVHVIYYRLRKNVIEIVRVLHERMEPTLHVGAAKRRRRRR